MLKLQPQLPARQHRDPEGSTAQRMLTCKSSTQLLAAAGTCLCWNSDFWSENSSCQGCCSSRKKAEISLA